jgi:hypothetical protein
MTLEHIQDTAAFVSTVRRSIGDRRDTVVLFQVPEVRRILEEIGFWDIYYEHCSYFSKCSLGHLFARCGFEVVNQWLDYGDQYLMIEARPAAAPTTFSNAAEVQDLEHLVDSFAAEAERRLASWRQLVSELRSGERRAALWGGGSKAVAFLTTLGVNGEIPCAVDINPHKHGTYLAGSGQQIVAPDYLKQYRPDLVILMNPMYRDEVSRSLDEMNVSAELINIETQPEGRLHAAIG